MATETVELMARLWEVKQRSKGRTLMAVLRRARRALLLLFTEPFALTQKTLPRIPGKSKLAVAIRYATSRRSIFERFLTDGRIELDSNIVERAIRPQTITRKNSLFAGSDEGERSRQRS